MTTSPLTVTTGAAMHAQAELAVDALHAQRERLIPFLRDLPEAAWAGPTRCDEWCVHDVVRHLCDVSEKWHGLLRGERPEELGLDGLDPRSTPAVWAAASAHRRPAETLQRFDQATAELLNGVTERAVARATDRVEGMPYGAVPWSVIALHVFWDAWVHERDILLPLGLPHPSSAAESRAAAAFAFLIGGIPFVLADASLDETVALDGAGGGTFHLEADDGIVSVHITDDDGTPEALRGELVVVVDSMVGRQPDLDRALAGPPERVAPLGRFRRFMVTPPEEIKMPSRPDIV